MSRAMQRSARGFTLIELMVVVVVIGILAAIAIPNYSAYVERGRRAEGRTALLAAANSLERHYTANNTYTTDLAAAGYKSFSGDTSAASAYNLAVTAGPSGSIATSFVVTATPVRTDALCGNLSINNLGVRGQTAGTAANCWQR